MNRGGRKRSHNAGIKIVGWSAGETHHSRSGSTQLIMGGYKPPVRALDNSSVGVRLYGGGLSRPQGLESYRGGQVSIKPLNL